MKIPQLSSAIILKVGGSALSKTGRPRFQTRTNKGHATVARCAKPRRQSQCRTAESFLAGLAAADEDCVSGVFLKPFLRSHFNEQTKVIYENHQIYRFIPGRHGAGAHRRSGADPACDPNR